MTLDPRTLAERMREAFDRAFAEPLARAEAAEELLAIRVAGEPYAVRLSEIAGVHAQRTIVRVPSATPELLGVVGMRRTIAPVYDLGALLGHAASSSPRWLFLVPAPGALAFAFDAFESHVRVPRARALEPLPESDRRYISGAMQIEGRLRPIIHVASLVEAVVGKERSTPPVKEP